MEIIFNAFKFELTRRIQVMVEESIYHVKFGGTAAAVSVLMRSRDEGEA
jgi:hypothetical protein